MPWGDGKVSMRVLNRMPWLKLVQQPPGLLLGPGEVHLGPNLLRQPQHPVPTRGLAEGHRRLPQHHPRQALQLVDHPQRGMPAAMN